MKGSNQAQTLENTFGEERLDWFMYRLPGSDQPDAKWIGSTLALWLNGPGESDAGKWLAQVLEAFRWNVSAKGGRRRFSGVSFTPSKDAVARQNISRLIEMLQELHRITHLLNWNDDPANDRPGWRKFDMAGTAISNLLARYSNVRVKHWCLCNRPLRLVDPSGSRSRREGWHVVPRVPERGVRPFYLMQEPDLGEVSGQEWRALGLVEAMEREGWLDRIIRCKACRTWAVARRTDQEHCSTACRQKTYHATTSYKKQRAANYLRKKQLALLKETRATRRVS
jgi:hypothetical protein